MRNWSGPHLVAAVGFLIASGPCPAEAKETESTYYCPAVSAYLDFSQDGRLYVSGWSNFVDSLYDEKTPNDAARTHRQAFVSRDCSTASTRCRAFFAVTEDGVPTGAPVATIFLPKTVRLGETLMDGEMEAAASPYPFGPYSIWRQTYQVEILRRFADKKTSAFVGIRENTGIVFIDGLGSLFPDRNVHFGACVLTSKRGLMAETRIDGPRIPVVD